MTRAFKKLERNGEIAVLYSPGFGAGWSTWNDDAPCLVFDREIAQAVLDGDREKAAAIAEKLCPGGYWGGAEDLVVAWVSKGSRFKIDEYDGSESIAILGPDYGHVA